MLARLFVLLLMRLRGIMEKLFQYWSDSFIFY